MTLAFDRSSVRTYDADGRLRVAVAHLTMEQCAPYRGAEIPGWDTLGLDAERVYTVYRPAAEIEKAAQSAANIPLLDEHIPVSADDHQPGAVVGAVGTNVVWNPPYLDSSLIVWARGAIDDIESGKQRELSMAYRYKPVIKRGIFNGQAYDLEMQDLVFNHCALVEAGRAGPTVMVGDSQLKLERTKPMKTKPSAMAAMARGALMDSVAPLLAADHALDFKKMTDGLTAKNWDAKKNGILGTLKTKLAQDADMEDVKEVIAMLDEAAVELAEGMKPDPAEDEEMTDEEKAAKKKADEAKQAADAEAAAKGEKDKDMKDKQAMDAAIAAATEKAVSAAVKIAQDGANATRSAEKFVQAWVGELPGEFESAEAVYRAAFTTLGMDAALKDVHPSAFKAILSHVPKPGEQVAVRKPANMAADSAVVTSVNAKFPHLARLKNA